MTGFSRLGWTCCIDPLVRRSRQLNLQTVPHSSQLLRPVVLAKQRQTNAQKQLPAAQTICIPHPSTCTLPQLKEAALEIALRPFQSVFKPTWKFFCLNTTQSLASCAKDLIILITSTFWFNCLNMSIPKYPKVQMRTCMDPPTCDRIHSTRLPPRFAPLSSLHRTANRETGAPSHNNSKIFTANRWRSSPRTSFQTS